VIGRIEVALDEEAEPSGYFYALDDTTFNAISEMPRGLLNSVIGSAVAILANEDDPRVQFRLYKLTYAGCVTVPGGS
jgi:hypothetical protein